MLYLCSLGGMIDTTKRVTNYRNYALPTFYLEPITYILYSITDRLKIFHSITLLATASPTDRPLSCLSVCLTATFEARHNLRFKSAPSSVTASRKFRRRSNHSNRAEVIIWRKEEFHRETSRYEWLLLSLSLWPAQPQSENMLRLHSLSVFIDSFL